MSPPRIDRIGERHEMLEIIKEVEDERYHGQRVYECKCDCGNIKKMGYNCFKHSVSCGCYIKKITSERTFKDLSGRKFNMITVLHREGNTYPVKYKCRCDCGNEIVVYSNYLKNRISCGCHIKREIEKKIEEMIGKKFGMLTVTKFIKDDKVGHGRLFECQCECGKKVQVYEQNLKKRYTTSCGDHDFVNGSKASTIKNISKLTKANSSGIRGVGFIKKSSKWRASIVYKNKNYYLGEYINFNDAVKARSEAEKYIKEDFLNWYTEYINQITNKKKPVKKESD